MHYFSFLEFVITLTMMQLRIVLKTYMAQAVLDYFRPCCWPELLVEAAKIPSNSIKSVWAYNFYCAKVYFSSSEFGMTCM